MEGQLQFTQGFQWGRPLDTERSEKHFKPVGILLSQQNNKSDTMLLCESSTEISLGMWDAMGL